MKSLLGALATLRHILIVGASNGLIIGLSWSIVVGFFSRDQLFNGTEFALSLTTPGLTVLIVWRTLKIRLWILIPVAYLTLLIPLLGMSIGGANILQLSIAGCLGGLFWSLPFILYYLVRWKIEGKTSKFLQNAGRIHTIQSTDPPG